MTSSRSPRDRKAAGKGRATERLYRLALVEVRFWERQADNRFYDLRALLAELRRSLREEK